jgi:uncharacterized protein involved in type VI secretion and phage assembly
MTSQERTAGIVIGKVTAVKDPEGLGRIQVSYPWMSATEQRWVSVAAPMAGGGRGAQFLPEEDDEAVICFDQGMWDHPYVIGFLWNVKQPPPSADPRLRMIRSKNGHGIYMIDSTPNGGNLGALIVQDAHGSTIVMTNGQVSIHAKGALAISADGNITLQGRLVKPLGGPI